MYDVIVVGARVAGSPLAMLLARRGHDVLVVDRASFPSDTVSSHFMQQTGLARLREWGILDRALAGCPPFRNITLTYTGIEFDGFADPIDGFTETYAPRRTSFDAALVDAAREAGADVRENTAVEDLLWEGDRVVGIRAREGDGPAYEARARVVVGADGANSIVADKVGAEMYDRHPGGCFIYYSYFSGLDWTGAHHRTGFGHEQMGAWPTNDGLTLVATMARREKLRSYRRDVEDNVAGTISRCAPELVEELRDTGVREERWRPMVYPDNYYRRSAGAGWALVGDAGYHKDPFTGQGMSDALKHAGLLADRLHAGLSGEQDLEAALAAYVRERDERTHHTFRFTLAISELELSAEWDAIFRAAAASPEYTRKFFGMVAGGVPGEEFFAPDNLAWLFETTGMSPAPALAG
ncbi:NAD(P)/FAD-dependent oxidoreductase [Actinomycetospora chiangmaiensis]|uniref:NAD(P)/FAD-dependent oxidoreductase n=1 Tax=Actinomycetospora chiangmaiensis TaxID=402650 RepID=UPI00037FEE44|nr:NAD(P)/FAD-dependent oxidoreductase [Actinomycetospora chiangmaiensis]